MPDNMQDYCARIAEMHRELGIPEDYAASCRLVIQPECASLVETEPDVFGRQPLLDAGAFIAWRRMRDAAGAEGVELQIVSAYRSADYQQRIFLAKLARGQRIDDILKVNAAPGYSEHHSGLALDIGCPGCEHLSEEFEHSPAFRWLRENAAAFGFNLSFPRDNPHGVLYEPWHWKFA